MQPQAPTYPGAPAPYPPYVPQRQPYGGTPDGLIVAGAVVGLVSSSLMILFSIMSVAFLSAFQDFFEAEASGPELPQAFYWFPVLFGLLSIVGLVGAILTLKARGRMKRSDGADGSTQAIVGGAMMVVGGGTLGGILALVGAIMATSRR